MTPAAGRIVGNYALGALIGRGGTSEVYAARHRFLGDPVAVKLLRADLAGDGAAAEAAIDAFVAEAARTRAIAHPAVVRVLDFGRDDASGCCYLVMERVDGETLAARLARAGRLDEAEVRRLGAAIADGVAAAHARGIVHRDLKPANVVLRGDQPTIVDFGIARHLGDRSAILTGRRIGTPAYMAPEQLTAGLVAPSVDVWALGVILFEAATGRLPFEGFDGGRCPQLFEAAPRAAAAAPVSPALDELIARCLEREPGRRPVSVAAIAAALRGEDGLERITQEVGEVGEGGRAAAGPAAAAPVAARPRRWPVVAGAGGALVVVGLVAAWRLAGGDAAPAPAAPVIDDAVAREPELEPDPGPEPELPPEPDPAPELAPAPAADAGPGPRRSRALPARPRPAPTPAPPRETLD